jgi:hypothetical protein
VPRDTHTHAWERPTEWITSKEFHCLEESWLASKKDAALWNCLLFLICQSFSILFPWIEGPSHHGTAPPIWRAAANILNKQSRTADKRWPSSLGVGRCANNSSPQNLALLRNAYIASGLDWSLVRPKQGKMDVRFGIWNVRNLYRLGSLMLVARSG